VSSMGISCRQGPHQVAQKLIKTFLPRRSAVSRLSPSRLVRVKSGAGWSIAGTTAIVASLPNKFGRRPIKPNPARSRKPNPKPTSIPAPSKATQDEPARRDCGAETALDELNGDGWLTLPPEKILAQS